MDTKPPQRPVHTQVIHFSNGNRAQAVFAPTDARVTDLVQALSLTPPQALMLIMGGAAFMSRQVSDAVTPLLTSGFVPVAASLDALIIDGGTQAGVMAAAGQAVAQQRHKPALLGVAPAGCVTYPGKANEKMSSDAAPLDPNHSHFVLVEAETWGGETETMYQLAQALSQQIPSITLLINGGDIAKREVVQNVRQRRPIILIEGSGRFADDLATSIHQQSIPPSDPVLAEIMADGDLHLFPLTGTAQQLEQLVRSLLK